MAVENLPGKVDDFLAFFGNSLGKCPYSNIFPIGLTIKDAQTHCQLRYQQDYRTHDITSRITIEAVPP